MNKEKLGTSKNIVIGVIYRSPNTKINYFNDELANVLEQIRQENKIVYLMGDYNINLLNSDIYISSGEFMDILYNNEFRPLISRPN